MIIHAVIFTWKDGVTRADVDAVTAALDDMRPSITGLISLDYGPDLVLRPLVAEIITPLAASRVATQVGG